MHDQGQKYMLGSDTLVTPWLRCSGSGPWLVQTLELRCPAVRLSRTATASIGTNNVNVMNPVMNPYSLFCIGQEGAHP